MRRLYIAEKPSVAKAIAAELGVTGRAEGHLLCGADAVTWCLGHLLEQAEPDAYTRDDVPLGKSGKKIWRQEDLPILPQSWLLLPRSEGKAQLTVIGRLLKQASEIVHAGDPDREGQLLVTEVLEHFACRKPVRRFWVSAQDPTSIRRGLQDLRDNARYSGMAEAARSRQRADWLIGMNLSRAYTLRAQRGGSRALLTVGRVQTPTLALVVARDREIEEFKPQPYYRIEAELERVCDEKPAGQPASSFVATFVPKDDQPGLDPEGRLVNEGVAAAVVADASCQRGAVTRYLTEHKRKTPPLPFALSDLTVLASRLFGYSAAAVLEACQALYETHKLTSYPRTDSAHLPEVQHADAPAVLAALRQVNPELSALIDRANPQRKSPAWNDKKTTAHHAIMPTQHAADKRGLSDIERRIYELVVRRYLAQFFPDHEYEVATATVRIAGYDFRATGKTLKTLGWKELEQRDSEEEEKAESGGEREEEAPAEQVLPSMAEGDAVRCGAATRKDCKTKAPPRFTEGSLVRAMEQIHKWIRDPEQKRVLREGDGIGTAATRAAILSDLRRREFLIASGKHLLSTALGRALVDALPESVKSPALTALYERMLKQIESGALDPEAFLSRQARFVAERVAAAADGALSVPAALAPVGGTRARAPRRGRRPGAAAHSARTARATETRR